MNGSWVTTLTVIRHLGKSVIYKLREFSSNQPSLHLLYFPPTVVLITLFLILNICYELPINYQYESCNSHMGMFIKPIFYFALRKFVCKLGATTNIYDRKYRIQGQFSKSQGKFSSHFASHIMGLFNSISYFQYQKAGRVLLNLQNLHWNITGVIINKFPTAILF